MQKYRLKFTIGDIFPPDDIVSQKIISLFMAFNDSMLVFKLMKKEEFSPTSEGSLLYLFRLHCSHLREAFQVLNDMEEKSEVKNILDKFPEKAKEKFIQLKDGNVRVHKVLEKIRHNFFHYLDPKKKISKNIKSALEKMKNNESEISFKGDKLKGLHFKIADDIALTILEEQTKGVGGIKEAMSLIAEVQGNFLRFINNFCEIYFEPYKIVETENKANNKQ